MVVPPVCGQNLKPTYNRNAWNFRTKTCGDCTIVPYLHSTQNLEPWAIFSVFFFDPVLQWDTLLPNDAWANMESGVRRWDGCFGAGFDLSDFGRPASFLSTRMFHTWKSSRVQQHCWYDTTYHVSFLDILNINTCKTLVYTVTRILYKVIQTCILYLSLILTKKAFCPSLRGGTKWLPHISWWSQSGFCYWNLFR